RKGVDKVTVAPSAKAIEAKEKLKRKWIEAIDKGVWENALKKYTLEQWKVDMKEKGVPRIPDGAEKAKGKMADFGAKLLPYIDAGLSRIKELPSITLEDNIRRATEWIRYMSQFRKS
ncbi:MAG: hypothetical protein QXZ10_04330, partial [Sulfolobales archaeon]